MILVTDPASSLGYCRPMKKYKRIGEIHPLLTPAVYAASALGTLLAGVVAYLGA